MSDEQMSLDELKLILLKRILLEKRRGLTPGLITAGCGISREIYEQAHAAGLIDEDGWETF